MKSWSLIPASRVWLAALVILLGASPATWAQSSSAAAQPAATPVPTPAPDYSLQRVLRDLRAETRAAKARLRQREAAFEARLRDARNRRADAQKRLAELEAEGTRLEGVFEENKVELEDKLQLLQEKFGALKELFGVFQQSASDLIGAFVSSPTSLQFPDRDKWLEGFAERMKDASEVSSTAEIRRLWWEMLREIDATGEIVRLEAPVLGPEGETRQQSLVRIGAFNLVTTEPEPAYLQWRSDLQQVARMPRQPAGPYLSEVENYVSARQGLQTLSTDPTGGVLLSLLSEKPDMGERIDQGGLVGYMILALGAVALLLALFKLVDITQISMRVRSQQSRTDQPSADNSLGRLLQVYQDNRNVDSETLELRLHERVVKESSRVNRFTVFLAIIAAVAPLMGLLGTVVGMINTFQAITLYGTGDPQTMAGGISQALITTVLGLIVAVPAVLLHAVVSARGKSVVNVLRQHSAALTGDRLAAEGNHHAPPPAAAAPQGAG